VLDDDKIKVLQDAQMKMIKNIWNVNDNHQTYYNKFNTSTTYQSYSNAGMDNNIVQYILDPLYQ
jgi:hypothetical protein